MSDGLFRRDFAPFRVELTLTLSECMHLFFFSKKSK